MSALLELPTELLWRRTYAGTADELQRTLVSRENLFSPEISSTAIPERFENRDYVLESYSVGPAKFGSILVSFWDPVVPEAGAHHGDAQVISMDRNMSFDGALTELLSLKSWGHRLRYWFVLRDSMNRQLIHSSHPFLPLMLAYRASEDELSSHFSHLFSQVEDSPRLGAYQLLAALLASRSRGAHPGLELASAIIDFDSWT